MYLLEKHFLCQIIILYSIPNSFKCIGTEGLSKENERYLTDNICTYRTVESVWKIYL